MQNKTQSALYRIGDYCRFMGVSPDLLKHYEKLDLIQSLTLENGYHYYAFQESVPLLECMRLRSYGFSLRETRTALKELPYDAVKLQLDDRIRTLEERIRREQLILEEQKRISDWMRMMADCDEQVFEKEVEPLLFLPQSRFRDFIKDARISALLEPWVGAMPLVKSCRMIPDVLSGTALEDASWGLCVSQSHAEQLGLPRNDVVQCIPAGRYLHIHYRWVQSRHGSVSGHLDGVCDMLRQRGVQPAGPVYQVALMTMDAEHDYVTCGWFAVPLG